MTNVADRWRRVAGRFGEVARDVPDGAWERPAPCEGWVARDVVAHMVEWMPSFLSSAGGPDLPTGPAVDVDPARAWAALSDGIQALLDDPAVAGSQLSHPRAGSHRFDDAVATFFLGDVLIHTWDLARATGLDETLDVDEVAGMLAGLEPMDEMLRASGHYGPKVDVGPDADVQTRLIAFMGRQP